MIEKINISLIISTLILGGSIYFSAKEIRKGIEHNSNVEIQKPVQPGPSGDSSKLNIKGRPFLGKENAPVSIIVCSDYQCPFCDKFNKDVIKSLINNEVKDGKVKVVMKQYPLAFHQNAKVSAIASECANIQGRFWDYHDLLFSNISELNINTFKGYAKKLNLDVDKFNKCLDKNETENIVEQDRKECESAGVTGTPTSFINEKMIVGAQPYDQFKNLIAEKLKN